MCHIKEEGGVVLVAKINKLNDKWHSPLYRAIGHMPKIPIVKGLRSRGSSLEHGSWILYVTSGEVLAP